ncbi:MAG: FliA/WhiG family RNA polymerase sigma factor [Deltaproteobacteria bacterium]|nr:FliA/WhiG family RNA polymerase sigma factor [Deltaproteobacteria bacterium]
MAMELAEREIEQGWQGNNTLRDELITKYLPYVKSIAHRMAIHLPPSVEADDLVNAGVIGLMNAIERYDSTRENKFITYAVFRIRGAILSELRSRDFLSRSNRSKIRELEKAYRDLNLKLGRAAKDDEVAKELGIGLDEFYEIRKMSTMSFVSFEEIGSFSNEEKDDLMRLLVDGDSDDPLSLAGLKEMRNSIAGAVEQLRGKEKMVVSLYYWDELTMKEIGKVLDITESRVSQIHSQALIHLRARLRKEGLIMN